jgi:hypothetical protein
MSESEYGALADAVAPTLVGTPGMVSKVYLADPVRNTYGGLYTWRDRASMEAYLRSDVIAMVKSHPNLINQTFTDFGVLERPTRVNSAMLALTA